MYPVSIADAASFGTAVRAARKELGLSQRALAGRCGCSQRFVSELERGKSTAELGKALLVMRELGLGISASREARAEHGREAVDRLAASVSERLARKTRVRTSLADYLED